MDKIQMDLGLEPSRRQKPRAKPPPPVMIDHRKELLKLIRQIGGGRYTEREIFPDFCEAAACAVSNSVDKRNWEAREKRYLEVVGRYERKEVDLFPKMFGHLVMALEGDEPTEVLGGIFTELGLVSDWKAQVFTPMSVARMMAEMTVVETAKAAIAAGKGFFSYCEPTVGAGVLVIAAAAALRAAGINYQRTMHVTACDVDIRMVHLTYLQLSLLGIPAVVVHGNSLSLEEWSHWYTPLHFIGGWDARLARQRRKEDEHGDDSRAALPADAGAPALGPNGEDRPETRGRALVRGGRNASGARRNAGAGGSGKALEAVDASGAPAWKQRRHSVPGRPGAGKEVKRAAEG